MEYTFNCPSCSTTLRAQGRECFLLTHAEKVQRCDRCVKMQAVMGTLHPDIFSWLEDVILERIRRHKEDEPHHEISIR